MSVSEVCSNLADPLFMWITHNYVNRAENTAPAWGASIYLGEPPQPFSIRPSIDDFSMVALAGNCGSLTSYACIARRGGVYDPGYSTTVENSTDVEAWNGTIGTYNQSLFDFHNDVLTFGWNDSTVYGWPFVTDDDTYWATRNWLGIGLNSSFLNAAVEVGAAPAKSWGMWTGSRSITNPQDGLLILGGYDNARKGEEWTVFPGDEACPTCIQISDIEWVTDTNSTSLFNGSVEAIQVSLDPWYDNIRLPQKVWETFGAVTDGTYNDSIGYFSWPAGTTPPGKLRVKLQGGYETEIPHDEIFTKPRYYDSTGNYTISDNTTEYALIYNYTNTGSVSNAVGSWGLPFLTMNYLVLNVEKQEFWLTPAVRQNFGNEGGVFPRKLCTGLKEPTATPTSSPTTTTPTPTSTTSAVASGGGGTPVGAIVGGVVGGVAGIALIALLAFMLLRRRNRANKEAEIANSSAYPPPPPMVQNPHPHHSYMGGPPPPGVYSPTQHSYPSSPPFGNSAHNSMGYAGVPMGGPQSDYSNDIMQQQHSGPQFYSPSPSVKPEHASMVYSDTATAVPELASPGQQNSEWRADGAKDMSATVSRPFDSTWSEGPHQR